MGREPPLRRPHSIRALSFVLREITKVAGLAVVATAVMFLLLYAVAPDPSRPVTEDRGLVDFVVRYLSWARGAVVFSFGDSPYTHRSIGALVAGAAPRTLGLLLLGIVSSVLVNLLFGWRFAGARGGIVRVTGYAISLVSLIPVYLLAFALRTGPGGAFQRVETGLSVPETLLLLVTLAALLVLSNGLFSESLGTTAAVLRQEASEPYVRSLVARGIRPERFMLRNGAGVLLGGFVGQIPRLVTAVFVLEWAFNIHGIGYEAIRAFDYEGRRDIPVILAMTFLSVLLVRALVLIARLAVWWLNPRLRLER
jgi:peptide/nickel transport system permease protein